MSDNQRLEELRRRVAKDPASIAFAHLAEEYRRCGHYKEAVETCRAGLVHHSAYLSARVTLARALMELGELDHAQGEIDVVLATAPENLAAMRTLSEIHQRRGEAPPAGAMSPTTLAAVKDQDELEQMIRRMSRTLDAEPPEANRRLRPGSGGQEAAAPKPPDTDHELFALFGAALNSETGKLRDTAREEFFGAPPAEPGPVPVPPAASRHATLELRPAAPPAPFDEQVLANLDFRKGHDESLRPKTEAPNDPEVEEARQLLHVLEQWLTVIETRPS